MREQNERWRRRITFGGDLRASAIFFLIFLAINWLAHLFWGQWLAWQALVLIAASSPAAMLLVTWDGDDEFG